MKNCKIELNVEYEIFINLPEDEDVNNLNFYNWDQQKGQDITLHISFRKLEQKIVVSSLRAGKWAKNKELKFDYANDSMIKFKYIELEEKKYAVELENESETCIFEIPQGVWLSKIDIEGNGVSSPQNSQLAIENLWRFDKKKSGFPALYEKYSVGQLTPGLSMIIRAKNEAHNIENCIRSIAPHVDEVIFVDNGSTDNTRLIVEKLQKEYFNIKVYSYPVVIPRAGEDHAKAVFNHSTNTLGHYYNWCLEKSTMVNFAKWDADYVCISENFKEMLKMYNLRRRGDNFSLWFSGLEVYTDGGKYWVDQNSCHSEYRVFSRKHGAHWVNLPPWEEMEQSYLYKSNKMYYTKPVYVELFRLDEIEFRDRGIFTDDKRDKERLDYIKNYKENGTLPEHFVEVDGVFDPKLAEMDLSANEVQMANDFKDAFSKYPRINLSNGKGRFTDFYEHKVPSYITMIMSCKYNRAKQDVQRNTWIKDQIEGGLPYLFVEGSPGMEHHIIDDTLFLDCRDEYDFLASKVYRMIEYVYYHTDYEYLYKIDDDVILNPIRLNQFKYWEHDYIGGEIAKYTGVDPLWHRGKCWNDQLNDQFLHVKTEAAWYGGQYGYFLSRKAMKILLDNKDAVRGSLYEDTIVGDVLAQAGYPADMVDNNYKAINYDRWLVGEQCHNTAVSDIPNTEEMYRVYNKMKNSKDWRFPLDIYHEKYSVHLDWMDIDKVRADLLGK